MTSLCLGSSQGELVFHWCGFESTNTWMIKTWVRVWLSQKSKWAANWIEELKQSFDALQRGQAISSFWKSAKISLMTSSKQMLLLQLLLFAFHLARKSSQVNPRRTAFLFVDESCIVWLLRVFSEDYSHHQYESTNCSLYIWKPIATATLLLLILLNPCILSWLRLQLRS